MEPTPRAVPKRSVAVFAHNEAARIAGSIEALQRSGLGPDDPDRNPFATAVVPEFVKNWVDETLPYKVSQQAKRKRMSYRGVAEFMSERYHCDVPYLVELNGNQKINNIKPRDTIIVPNVTPRSK